MKALLEESGSGVLRKHDFSEFAKSVALASMVAVQSAGVRKDLIARGMVFAAGSLQKPTLKG